MSNSFLLNGPTTNHVHDKVIKYRPRHKIWAYWFPVISCLFTLSAFLAGYIIAVLNEDEKAWFSFISDGGAVSPESCIFGILLNYGAFFWILSAICLHIHLSQFMQFYDLNSMGWILIRRIMLAVVIVSTFGLTVVANFQETNVPRAHGIGAWLAFFGGLLYVWLYIIVSIAIKPKFAPNSLTSFRVLFAVITTISLAIHMTAQFVPIFAKKDANGNYPDRPKINSHKPVKLDPDDPWYGNHLLVTVSEWVLGISFQIIIFTFSYELGTFTVNALTTEQLAETTLEPELKNIKPLY